MSAQPCWEGLGCPSSWGGAPVRKWRSQPSRRSTSRLGALCLRQPSLRLATPGGIACPRLTRGLLLTNRLPHERGRRAHLVDRIRRIHASGVTICRRARHDCRASPTMCTSSTTQAYLRGQRRSGRSEGRRSLPRRERDSQRTSVSPELARNFSSRRTCCRRDLSTNYGAIRALHGVTFDVPEARSSPC
jgi:hypothetical protein